MNLRFAAVLLVASTVACAERHHELPVRPPEAVEALERGVARFGAGPAGLLSE
jgi:hypothetical protein